eukprot:scaffold44559_cov64-Phaeocystis_antarctica.AAC.2
MDGWEPSIAGLRSARGLARDTFPPVRQSRYADGELEFGGRLDFQAGVAVEPFGRVVAAEAEEAAAAVAAASEGGFGAA